MRVVFVGKNHEFSMAPLKAIGEHHAVAGIVESGPRASQQPKPFTLKFLLSSCKQRFATHDSLRSFAQEISAPYMYLYTKNRADLVGFLRKIKPELICVASLSQLLQREVLDIPKHGAINLHPSLLPKYRGPFPWFWQYYNYEKQWGVTVHAIDEGQDTGPIIKQEAFGMETGTGIDDAIKIVSRIGARLMLEAVNEIEAGTAVRKPQPQHQYPKARVVLRDEKLIEWDTWEIERVWHFLRGTYPWLDSVEYPKRLFNLGTWRVGKVERGKCSALPGKVFKDDKGYFIAHRDGKLRLHIDYPWGGWMKRFMSEASET